MLHVVISYSPRGWNRIEGLCTSRKKAEQFAHKQIVRYLNPTIYFMISKSKENNVFNPVDVQRIERP